MTTDTASSLSRDTATGTRPLAGRVALVAGGTRGGGRGIAVELGAAGATVYVTGRSSRTSGPSDLARRETVEETAEQVTAAGGLGIAVRADHSDPEDVRALVARIAAEQDGRLDVLVNCVWGGDPLTDWEHPLWEQDLDRGLRLLRQAVETHVITSRYALPLLVARGRGLVVEVTDGNTARYRGSFFYDLAKSAVIRLAVAQAAELRPHGVTAVAVTPGFLRSEAMLDGFGVTEANWRDGAAKDPNFAYSESPAYLGRAVAALAADPDVPARTGQALATWELYKDYGFTDTDGTQPDWAAHWARNLAAEHGPL
ncbi:SDR family oxidoreductase [Actinacidiphila paucisporea]|uniref:NAD(P)-dependent dehydrogenase, short-chain alcohol dehydrogenase family n=1 Tax=Actinacidiphila paucisporea TaxID=310782 RepID=A0A1M7PIE0_9ACTN|nr:SDR family oxidoreductase [Actinacidiphila paucisporea]SHN16826.1 NAD(P)-dependent dehydrogenase, short-chain alcohol dehydrogenase family [Actinacidiphila paucisporea]